VGFSALFRRLIACSGLLLQLVHASAVAQTATAETPQAATVKVCSGCHTMQIVTDTPKDYDAWHDTVQSMIDRGAQGTPEEFDLVMQFLFENMTTVDVNHADRDTLATVLHTSPAIADAIIARRNVRPFKNLGELESAISGLDRPLLESKKRMIFFQ
jgi:DNA uptake protein ComE-like DNA-binding protein